MGKRVGKCLSPARASGTNLINASLASRKSFGQYANKKRALPETLSPAAFLCLGGILSLLGKKEPLRPPTLSAMKPIYTPEQVSHIIRYAWEDRTTFEEIEKRTGLSEKQVIDVMRRELKPSSFRMWRKRVCGRVTKHRRLLEQHLRGPLGDE